MTTTTTAAFTVAATYLMWIGSEGYKTIADWVKEALEIGVSKRLPNAHVAKALLEAGTVVFVAHDEGEKHDCPDCTGPIECPECRKEANAATREKDVAHELTEQAAAIPEDTKDKEQLKLRNSLLLRARNANRRAAKHEENIELCDDCFGEMITEGGTGGTVLFEDGDVWDFRKYSAWLHRPTVWTPADKGGIAGVKRCETCGGTGTRPETQVFGFFVPENIDYIDGGDEEKKEAAEADGFKVVTSEMLATERKRGCGLRKPGGVYAATKVDSESTAGEEAAEAMGFDKDAVIVNGNFVQFVRPIKVDGYKRFRGIKKVTMTDELKTEMDMIAEAM